MKASIKKRLSVGVKLRVVSFQRKISKRFGLDDKEGVLARVAENPGIKNFRIVSENIEAGYFGCEYDMWDVPERIAGIRSIDTVQTNAIMFDGGSWLYYGPAAQSELTEKGFKVWEIDREGNICDVIEYEFCE